MAELKIENVSFTYGKKTPYEKIAVDSVSHTFLQNGITGIIGHTGSGKSTLIQMFNSLIIPDSGRITLDGEDINEDKKKYKEIRSRVGLVFQYPEYQLFADTVFEDISFGPKNLGRTEEEIKESVDMGAAFSGVSHDWYEKSPFDLSGGQKRRVAIAGVIAMKPEILVLDEPVAGLDPAGRTEILKGLKKYVKENNATVIIVSHSMKDMTEYADEIVVMNKGKKVLSGSCKEVFSKREDLINYKLGVPASVRFLSLLEKEGIEVSDSIFTTEELYSWLLPKLRRGSDES